MDPVESYPMTAEDYPKVIDTLTQRIDKPKILKQVYVREILKLVIRNSKQTKKIQLSVLYDKLEAHLRALESLGVTHEQTAEFLFPMIESSVSEDILVAWQRSPLSRQDGSKCVPEVESESQRDMVRAGFETMKIKKEKTAVLEKKEDLPTAAGLFSGQSKQCVFCFKTNHQSTDCKVKIKCLICGDSHFKPMCPNQKPQDENGRRIEFEVQLSLLFRQQMQVMHVEMINPTFIASSAWWEGPDWLKGPRDEWPSGQEEINEDDVSTEMKKPVIKMLVTFNATLPWYLQMSASFYKNIRIIAMIRRFIRCLKGEKPSPTLER
ncbi:hypothetical protein Fcan01_25585 [Folsomia candida]|uniref:Uncharacterized protein n=1 Tax=Folsomia candida TaxID=158441 RepID=A0A226D2K6_FOLCA|nr:hypothetical protein Fcan01_25585 [Folsomia candida]